MLIDCIVMIHVELHHRDDLAEIRDELAEHAGLVHPAQDQGGFAPRGQDRQEEPVRLLVLAHIVVDQPKRARHPLQRVRVELQAVQVRDMEEPDQVDGIALEDVGVGIRDAAAILDEFQRTGDLAGAPRHAGDHARQARRLLGLLFFQSRTKDTRQVADILGDEEIVLHEAFDRRQARMVVIVERLRDIALDVEGKAVFRLSGDEVHVASNRPEEVLRLLKQLVLLSRQDPELDQFLGRLHPVEVFGDPEQRVEVAKAALALLDIGLDQIARIAGFTVALVALGELRLDEFGAGRFDDLGVEPVFQHAEELFLPADISCFQDRGADRDVFPRKADALVDGACRVADLQAHVPEDIEQELDDLRCLSRILGRQDEEEIDVRTGSERRAAVAADCRDRQRARWRIGGGSFCHRRHGVVV
jgi:hypothetical protein